VAYEQKRQYEQAIAALEKYGETNKDDPLFYGSLGHIYAVSGRIAEARRMIHEMKKLEKKDRSATYSIALVYAGVGDKDSAFAWLEKGARAKAMSWFRFRYDPRFAIVRDDPRFRNFLRLREEALANRN
jgi:Flp pilus assembly protein TadD